MGDEEHPIPLHRGVWGVGELKVVLTHLINLINRHFPLVTFGSDSNLWVFVEEVLQVVREVNDTLLHVGDVAPSIELNFTQELGVVCHLRQFAYFFNSVYVRSYNLVATFALKYPALARASSEGSNFVFYLTKKAISFSEACTNK